MAIPNTDWTTAIVIPSVPFNLTTTANDAGATYTLWYKYVTPADEVLSVFGWGSGVGYSPYTTVYEFFGGSIDSSPEDRTYPTFANNLPVQFHARVGKTYYFRFSPAGGPPATSSTLVIDIIRHATQVYPNESLMIPDDTHSMPGAILSPTTGEVLKFVINFPAGEVGDALLDGTILTEDYMVNGLKLYDGQLNLLISLPSGGSIGPGTNGGFGEVFALHSSNPKFYVGRRGIGGGDNATIRTVSSTGVVGSTVWTLPGAGLVSIGVNQAETIAYVTGQGGSAGKVKKWDLVNSVFLADHPAPAGSNSVRVMKNDNVVIAISDYDTKTITIREYSNTDTLLHTYIFTDKDSIRMKAAVDDPLSIWCWFEDAGGGFSNFVKLRLSDGVHLQDSTSSIFESGVSEVYPQTATPPDRFGHSFSCPIFLLFQGTPSPPDLSGIYYINPVKATKHDSYYNDTEKKIPDPTIRTGLFGE